MIRTFPILPTLDVAPTLLLAWHGGPAVEAHPYSVCRWDRLQITQAGTQEHLGGVVALVSDVAHRKTPVMSRFSE